MTAPNARLVQIAMCSGDLPATTRLYEKALGFASAGGRPLWGERIARIQSLPSGADTALFIWWLVGRQDFVQLELFTHTTPVQRPRPADWRASDLGWVRWGVAVDDLDATLSRLARAGVQPLTEPVTSGGSRRVCFLEPGAAVLVELIEQPQPARPHFYDLSPAVHYVAVSVPELDRAVALFDSVGLREADPLHRPEDEALWGLPGASSRSRVLTDGDIFLEIVQYDDPPGRAPAPGRLLSDQGFMNIALGFRERADLVAAFARLEAAGCTARSPLPELAGGTYVTTPDGLSLELLVAPRELDAGFGFAPMANFHRPLIWPGRLGDAD
jgi:catechol 2,3-dioxygenase-like lactoylglutathione lyase family enzyme